MTASVAYTASAFEPTLPTGPDFEKSATWEIIVQRTPEVESWSIYTIWGLGWANLVFGVISLHLFTDKLRRQQNSIKNVVTPPRERKLEAAKGGIDLILMN